MRDEETAIVRALDLFAAMDEAHFSELTGSAYLQIFPPGVVLISEGDPADFLYVVVEGCVELFARTNGRETTMELIRPVTTFILAAVLKDAVYLMSARTIEKSRILLIPSDKVRAWMDEDDEFARAIVRELANCYRRVIKAHKNQKLRPGVDRLANYLLQQHEQQDAGDTLQLPCDKRTLASLLGMTPENLSRAFGTLGPYGVEVNGSRITLTKLDDLRGLARPNPLIDTPVR